MQGFVYTHDEAPAGREGRQGLSGCYISTEREGLEPPRACARRISSAVPYQLGLALLACAGMETPSSGARPSTSRGDPPFPDPISS